MLSESAGFAAGAQNVNRGRVQEEEYGRPGGARLVRPTTTLWPISSEDEDEEDTASVVFAESTHRRC